MARRPAKVMELSQGDRALLEVWSRATGKTHRTAFEFEFAVSLVGVGGAMGFYIGRFRGPLALAPNASRSWSRCY